MLRVQIVLVRVALHLNLNGWQFHLLQLHHLRTSLLLKAADKSAKQTKPHVAPRLAPVALAGLLLAGGLVVSAQWALDVRAAAETHGVERVAAEHCHEVVIAPELLVGSRL
jgi:hypothetical protein